LNRRLLLAGLVLLVVIVSAPGEAQIQPNADCVAAKTWHLQQAMKLNLEDQQAYHLGAADAAGQLSTVGGAPCLDWKRWANGVEGSTAA